MPEESEEPELEVRIEDSPRESHWSPASFLVGLVLGAAVGAGVALLLAPASGEETRGVLRRRVRALTRDASGGWVSVRDEARRRLREKKEALRDRLEQVAERLE